MNQFKVNPWVRDFQPPSKCPQCKRVNMLVFTGERTKSGDHIYKCTYPGCGATIGAPTEYACCNGFGKLERIEKDIFFSPCVKCFYRRSEPTNRPGGGVCIHFRVKPYEEFA